MRSKIRNSLTLLKQWKIDKLLDAIAWNVPHWLFYYSHSILVMTDKPRWHPRPQPGCSLRFVKPEDIRMLANDGFTDRKIASRLAAGDLDVQIENDDEVMTICWGCRGGKLLQLSGPIFDPGPDGFFAYGVHTDKKVRLRWLFYNVSQYIYDIYSQEG